MTTGTQPALRRYVNPVPPEGEGGYSVSWWPICLSGEVIAGKLFLTDFLDGKVIVTRNGLGEARVLSPYCPHLGANLANGDIVDDTLRCPFHHWRYDMNGRCIATGIGDPAPPTARLFPFPTRERYGLVWAFNGLEPTWELPDFFPKPDAALRFFAEYDRNGDLPCDAWVGMANTPDWNHLMVVHRLAFDTRGINDSMEFTDTSLHYRLTGRLENGAGAEIDYDRYVHGTNIFVMHGWLDGSWFGVVNPLLQLGEGKSRNFFIVAVDDRNDPPAEQAYAAGIMKVAMDMVNEDWPIVSNMTFRPGTLTKSDAGLARFLDYVRRFPRAHPSADFIR